MTAAPSPRATTSSTSCSKQPRPWRAPTWIIGAGALGADVRSETMALSWRTSVLADRHRALGSKLEDWNGMGTAWTYSKDVAQDHVAIRTKAGLMDVSGLKKLYLAGPHSSAVLNYATTRDVTKIYPGKCAYSCMLNENGHFIEDCILYRMGPNPWPRWRPAATRRWWSMTICTTCRCRVRSRSNSWPSACRAFAT